MRTVMSVLALVVLVIAAGWGLSTRLVAPKGLIGSARHLSETWLEALASPLVGVWFQGTETPCGKQREMEERRIRELVFSRDGTFSFTFDPFCTYKDAWGTYSFDPRTRKLRLQFTGGNNVPTGEDFHGEGTAQVDLGENLSNDGRTLDRLILEGIVLGKSNNGKVCRMMFGRRSRRTQ